MTESRHNSIVLSPSNQEKFIKLYTYFAKTQANAMRFSEFMQFLLDRCLLTNKVTLKRFYQLFLTATQKRIDKEPPPTNPNLQKIIRKQQLIFLFNQLGKIVYHNGKGYHDKIYNDLLSQKIVADKQSINYARTMQMDQLNRKLFLENSVRILCSYQQQLRNLYLIYMDENYWALKNQGRILLTHRQIALQSKRMSAVSFVRLLKQAEVVPHLINIQQIEDILIKIVPPVNSRQSEFYYKHFLVDSYSKDIDSPKVKHQADPGLALFQFITAMARIGIQTSKQIEVAKKVYEHVIPKFFKNYLCLRTNEQISNGQQIKQINRIFIIKFKNYYKNIVDHVDKLPSQSEQQQQQKNPFQLMREKQRQMDKMSHLQFNIDQIMIVLQSQLPPMPQQIQVKQELPPPYPPKFKDLDKVTIGQQLPPQKVDKNKQMKPPPKKKPQLKKGQKPPRIFKYKEKQQQTKKIIGSEDYFQKLATQLDYSLKPISSFERGVIPIDPYPSLITQILYPNQIPESILPFIQAGLNAHNQGRFALAIENYTKAYQLWKQQLSLSDLKPALQLFFQFSKGSVYLSAGKDDFAFNSFFICKSISQKLTPGNPDRAVPYCGLGQVLYNAQQYQLSTRCYLKAREIRQKLLGLQSVDTATVFNNLGCCFFMLDRNKEALSYFKIAHTVLVSQLGQFHERSQTATQNEDLCNKSFYQNTPQYRKLWEVFEKDKFGKKKKKKKKDGKKK